MCGARHFVAAAMRGRGGVGERLPKQKRLPFHDLYTPLSVKKKKKNLDTLPPPRLSPSAAAYLLSIEEGI